MLKEKLRVKEQKSETQENQTTQNRMTWKDKLELIQTEAENFNDKFGFHSMVVRVMKDYRIHETEHSGWEQKKDNNTKHTRTHANKQNPERTKVSASTA